MTKDEIANIIAFCLIVLGLIGWGLLVLCSNR